MADPSAAHPSAKPVAPVRVAVLSDTHLRGPALTTLCPAVLASLGEASLILHAGDIVDGSVLQALAEVAPTYAVRGNNDLTLAGRLPDTLILEVAGVRVAMVHDSGARAGRPQRLRRRFPEADLVVFGHSHVPVDEAGADGQWLFNPGSPTQRRSQPNPSFGYLELGGGQILTHQIIPLQRGAGR